MQDQHARRVVVDDGDIERIRDGHLAVAAGHVREGKAGRVAGDDRTRIARHTDRRPDGQREAEAAHVRYRHQTGAVVRQSGRVATVDGDIDGVSGTGRAGLATQVIQDGLQRFAGQHQMAGDPDPAIGDQAYRPHLAGRGRPREVQHETICPGADRQIPAGTLDDRQGGVGQIEHQLRIMRSALDTRAAAGAHRLEYADRVVEVGDLRGRLGQPHARREWRAVGAGDDQPGTRRLAGNLATALQVEPAHRQLEGETVVVGTLEGELAVGLGIAARAEVIVAERIDGGGELVGDLDQGIAGEHLVADCLGDRLAGGRERPDVVGIRCSGQLHGRVGIVGREARAALVDQVGQARGNIGQILVLELAGVAELDPVEVDGPDRARRAGGAGSDEQDVGNRPRAGAAVRYFGGAQSGAADRRRAGRVCRQKEADGYQLAACRNRQYLAGNRDRESVMAVDQRAQLLGDFGDVLAGIDCVAPGLAVDHQGPGFAFGRAAAQGDVGRKVGGAEVVAECRAGDGDRHDRSGVHIPIDYRLERAVDVAVDLAGQAVGDVA